MINFSNLTIFQKGIILVALPLLSELVFVGILVTLQMSAEKEAEALTRSKQILTAANDIPRELVEGASAVMVYKLTGSELAVSRFDQMAKRLGADLTTLKELCSRNPQKLAQVQEIEKSVNRSIIALNEMRDAISQGKDAFTNWRMNHPSKEMTNLLKGISRSVSDLIANEQSASKDPESGVAKSRKRVIQWLVLGMVANVALALGMVMFLSAEIVNRLGILSENTKRFLQKEDLSERLTGTDEIAEVDRVFHDMALTVKEAERKQRELEQTKQEFVAMLTHDMRTPLTSLNSFLEGVVEGVYDDKFEVLLDRSEQAQKQVARLVTMIGHILDVEKADAGMLDVRKEQVSSATVINKAVEAVFHSAQVKQIEIEKPENDLKIAVDAELMVRVMENLLSNAVKFSPQSGKISITLSEIEGMSLLAVHDQGPGIPQEEADLIFEKFRQSSVHSKKGGTGLGLAFCKKVLAAHGGKIWVESEPGKGTTFKMEFPSVVATS